MMDVNSVMSTYNLSTLWSSYTSNSSSVPLAKNVSSTVGELYTGMNYAGGTTSAELSDIYKTVEPSYGMSATYDAKGNVTGNVSTTSSVVSLLASENSTSGNTVSNILGDYKSIESGAYKASLSSSNVASILSSNSSNLYSTVGALLSDATISSGSIINSLA